MPKKLADLIKTGNDLQSGYDELMTTLRSFAQSGSQHERMISEGEEAIDGRIEALLKSGSKGTLIGDFERDPEVKAFVKGVETQKAAYLEQCKKYWKKRDELDKLLASCQEFVKDATDKITKKEDSFYKSKSLDDMKSYRDNFADWLKDVTVVMKKIRQTSLPTEKRALTYCTPGSTSKTKLEELHSKQPLHHMDVLLKFVTERALVDKTRGNTLKAIAARLAQAAKENPDI